MQTKIIFPKTKQKNPLKKTNQKILQDIIYLFIYLLLLLL